MRGKLLLAAACCALTACGSTSSSVRAAATPTDSQASEVAAVKAAVTAFITAYAKSEQTGDAKPVEALTVPGSQAEGNAGGFAAAAIGSGVGFTILRLDIDQTSWHVTTQREYATVSVAWSAYGYSSVFPGGQQSGSPHESERFSDTYYLQKVSDQWLVASYS